VDLDYILFLGRYVCNQYFFVAKVECLVKADSKSIVSNFETYAKAKAKLMVSIRPQTANNKKLRLIVKLLASRIRRECFL